ncbi:MAG TPA: class I SAM-dependent methyltransferase [Gaiellaceae bacterium]|nr:class I SAM-dependent methyltransferase [Gaiellaceae bacterium]
MTADVEQVLAQEVRRLKQEVDRLRAIERSRWWRLNPRRILRERRTRSLRRQVPVAVPAPPPVSALARRFRDEVVSRGRFSSDWFTRAAESWEPLFQELAGAPCRLLEIGSYEGLSATYFLWRLPHATVTCVDTFGGSLEHAGEANYPAALEDAFEANVALVDASRIEKRVGESRRVLADLHDEGRLFDLVYVDGSHLALDVLVDAALSWRLLRVGGFLVFDDYVWAELGDDALLRPGPAVDAFLALVAGRHEVVIRTRQLGLRKTAA